MNNAFEPLSPPPRRLMGPGPVDVDPRVLQAMALPLLGQFDPRFTGYHCCPNKAIEGCCNMLF